MRTSYFLIIVLFCITSCGREKLTPEQIFNKTNESVVTIYALNSNMEVLSQGSGVVLNKNGWIITNYHVFDGASCGLRIIRNQDTIDCFETMIIDFDKEKDLLIFKAPDKPYYISLAHKEKIIYKPIQIFGGDSLNIGEKVYTIGSPLGLKNTISEGVISGFRSNINNYIQISAPISHGSSGGAVVNSQGELVGLTSLTIENGQNLNFAIPSNDIKSFYLKVGGDNNNYLEAVDIIFKFDREYANTYDTSMIKKCLLALKLAPKYRMPYIKLGEVYTYLAEQEREKNTKVLDEWEDENGAKMSTVQENTSLKKEIFYKKAISSYKKVIELPSPYDSAFYLNVIANLYRSLGNRDSAIFWLESAAKTDPKYYAELGSLMFNLKDFEGAIYFSKKALNYLSHNQDEDDILLTKYDRAFWTIYSTYREMKDYEGAVNFFNNIVYNDPKNAKVYLYLGYIHRDYKRYKDAIYCFKNAISINPNFEGAYRHLGFTFRDLGDNLNSNLYLEKASELNHRRYNH